MSERVRESIVASLLASKRFIVAVCAAIAMVLGAMSAGASVFTGTSTAESQTAASVFSETPRSFSSTSASNESPLFTRRPTLTSRTIAVQPPLYTTTDASQTKEKKGLNLNLNQDVVKASSSALFYNPTPLIEEPDSNPAASLPTEPDPADTDEPPVIPAEPTEPSTPDPTIPSEPTPTPDPTTEPGLNNMSSPNPESTEQPLKS